MGDKHLHRLHGMAAQKVAEVAQAALNACDESTANRAYVAIGAAIGAIEPLAFMISDGGAEMDNDRILFACLLTARAVRIAHSRDRGNTTEVGQHTEFGATIIYETLLAFEKLTGRNIDHKLNPLMVEAARDPECRAEMERQREMCMAQEQRLHATVN